MSEDLKALNRRFNDEAFSGRFEVVDELLADDFVEHIPMPGFGSDKEGTKQMIKMFRTAFPDARFETDIEIQEGDMLFALLRFSGTHSGELMGIPATGKRVSLVIGDVARARDGKFVDHWTLFDPMALMQQLGVTPQAA